MTWVLTLKHTPTLRADFRAIVPGAFVDLATAEIERLPVHCGNDTLPLAELCAIARSEDGAADTLVLEGDFTRCDRIGWQLDGGRIDVRGDAGDYVGAGMAGGAIRVQGSAGLLAGCEMRGGTLDIGRDAGDFAGGALAGSMEGMRGGTLVVRGRAGERTGDRMRRGTLLVFGDAGAFAGSRMVAGTLAIGGAAGAHCGWGMRRGSIVCAGAPAAPGPTFVETRHDIGVYWQLLARSLARHGGPFASLPGRRVRRLAGDLGANGLGELLLAG